MQVIPFYGHQVGGNDEFYRLGRHYICRYNLFALHLLSTGSDN